MKVNVTGTGFIQGVGLLPQRNIELNEIAVRRLFNFRNCKVYLASTGELLTPTYFERKKADAEKAAKTATHKVVATKEAIPSAPAPAPVIEPKALEPYIAEPTVEPEPYVEPVIEVVPEVVEEPAVEEEAPVEIGVDVAPAEDVVVDQAIEETVDEEQPAEEDQPQRYNGKKKKRH